jgi:hypothetical protein
LPEPVLTHPVSANTAVTETIAPNERLTSDLIANFVESHPTNAEAIH